jgi:thiamine-phosphate pyrophosphorylase
MQRMERLLRFYFITDDDPQCLPALEQVRIALAAGATLVQYRCKRFELEHYAEVVAIRDLCRSHRVPLTINDHVLLAKAVEADGVHLGQKDADPRLVREILGDDAIVGLSVSTPEELARSPLEVCDYIGSGPVFGTQTKEDAKPIRHLTGLKEIVDLASLPVVAIGGITAENAAECLSQGAAGVAVISAVTRAADPAKAAAAIAAACDVPPPSAEENFESVLETYNPADIAVIKSILEDAGIFYHFHGEHLLLRPLGAAARLMVARRDAEEARALLADLNLNYTETFYADGDDNTEDDEED